MIPLIVFSKNIKFCQFLWTERFAASKLKVQEKVVASCLYLFLPASYWKFTRNSLKIVSIYSSPQGLVKFDTKVSDSCQSVRVTYQNEWLLSNRVIVYLFCLRAQIHKFWYPLQPFLSFFYFSMNIFVTRLGDKLAKLLHIRHWRIFQ